MYTVTIQIERNDDRLTKIEWAKLVVSVSTTIILYGEIDYFGASKGDEDKKNACWVAKVNDSELFILQREIKKLKEIFNQDSIAWTVGETEFI